MFIEIIDTKTKESKSFIADEFKYKPFKSFSIFNDNKELFNSSLNFLKNFSVIIDSEIFLVEGYLA